MECVTCSKENKKNKHRLDTLKCPITYDSFKIVTHLGHERKYTSIHSDETGEIFISVGCRYNKAFLESEEATIVQSQVVGGWVKRKGKYQIHLRVIVSSEKNPQVIIRNKIFCEELGPTLEGIALAEQGLLAKHPSLAKTKIYIHFESIDKAYDRVEEWHTLGYWSH